MRLLVFILTSLALLSIGCEPDDPATPNIGGDTSVVAPIGCPGNSTVTDIDGNVYTVVQIGSQCWMAENLKTTHYRNGEVIPQISDSLQWQNLAGPAWCWYNNDSGFDTPYGKLYKWFAVSDSRGICPLGWHVPGIAEWDALHAAIGVNVWQAMKAIPPLWDGTNASGFDAVPAGVKYIPAYSGFDDMGINTVWWTATQSPLSGVSAYAIDLSSFWLSTTTSLHPAKKNGFSCRCVRD